MSDKTVMPAGECASTSRLKFTLLVLSLQVASGRYPVGSAGLNAARPPVAAREAALLGLLLRAGLLDGDGDAGVL